MRASGVSRSIACQWIGIAALLMSPLFFAPIASAQSRQQFVQTSCEVAKKIAEQLKCAQSGPAVSTLFSYGLSTVEDNLQALSINKAAFECTTPDADTVTCIAKPAMPNDTVETLFADHTYTGSSSGVPFAESQALGANRRIEQTMWAGFPIALGDKAAATDGNIHWLRARLRATREPFHDSPVPLVVLNSAGVWEKADVDADGDVPDSTPHQPIRIDVPGIGRQVGAFRSADVDLWRSLQDYHRNFIRFCLDKSADREAFPESEALKDALKPGGSVIFDPTVQAFISTYFQRDDEQDEDVIGRLSSTAFSSESVSRMYSRHVCRVDLVLIVAAGYSRVAEVTDDDVRTHAKSVVGVRDLDVLVEVVNTALTQLLANRGAVVAAANAFATITLQRMRIIQWFQKWDDNYYSHPTSALPDALVRNRGTLDVIMKDFDGTLDTRGTHGDVWAIDGWAYITEPRRVNGFRLVAAFGDVTNQFAGEDGEENVGHDDIQRQTNYHGRPYHDAHRAWRNPDYPGPFAYGRPNDQTGHVRARGLGGRRDPLNFLPQGQSVNQGHYRTHEFQLMHMLRERCIDSTVTVRCDGDRSAMSWGS